MAVAVRARNIGGDGALGTVAQITIEEALAQGQRLVNWPVRGLLGTSAILYVSAHHWLAIHLGENTTGKRMVVVFVLCFIAAWLWWSVTVPKWRLRAYERIDDIQELKRRAVIAQLIWHDRSLFSRTEIKSAEHAARERGLEQRASAC